MIRSRLVEAVEADMDVEVRRIMTEERSGARHTVNSELALMYALPDAAIECAHRRLQAAMAADEPHSASSAVIAMRDLYCSQPADRSARHPVHMHPETLAALANARLSPEARSALSAMLSSRAAIMCDHKGRCDALHSHN